MKFTKEEISLCKQVAEKHRKELSYGDWFIWGDDVPIIASGGMSSKKGLIPLWTISDCLEFLNKRRFAIEKLYQPGWKNWGILIKHENVLHINNAKWTGKELEIRGSKTPLEAFLKAVLAVLEEGK